MENKSVGAGVPDGPKPGVPEGPKTGVSGGAKTGAAKQEKKKKEYGNGFAVKVLYPIFYWVFWLLMRLYHWPTFKGRKNLPEGACILCGNHSGYADPIWVFLAARLRYPPWTMAKEKIFRKPLFGRLLLAFRAFPVNRKAVDVAAVKKSLTVLKKGDKLLIFPEGTRVKKGKTSNPKSGALLLANRAGVPVVPVYITPNRKPFQPIKVIIGEAYTPAYSCRRPENDELDKLTAEMMARIYGLGEKK